MIKKALYIATMMLATVCDDALEVARCFQEQRNSHWYNGEAVVPGDKMLDKLIAATASPLLSWSNGSPTLDDKMCPGPNHNVELVNCNGTVSIKTKKENQHGPGFVSIQTWLMDQGYATLSENAICDSTDPLMLNGLVFGGVVVTFAYVCLLKMLFCKRSTNQAQGDSLSLLDRNQGQSRARNATFYSGRIVPSLSNLSEDDNIHVAQSVMPVAQCVMPVAQCVMPVAQCVSADENVSVQVNNG